MISFSVLILVVVEDGLVPYAVSDSSDNKEDVLILVVVEDGLVLIKKISDRKEQKTS